jgi:type VI secretion system protein ImpA
MSLEGLDLVQPIQADRPCGENLEDTPLMASLDAYQLFGQPIALDPALPWAEIKDRSLEGLARSKDLRLLTNLGAALLRTDGLLPFFETVTAASRWLEQYWADVYPLVDEDAMVRRNALGGFADQQAVLEGLRRAPMVSHRQFGRFGLRDVEIASKQAQPAEGEAPPDEQQVFGAFGAVPLDELLALRQGLGAAIDAAKAIDARMRAEEGSDPPPGFDRLLAQLGRMDGVLRARLAARPDGAALAAANVADAGAAPAASGPVRSRQDAIRAMEAVAEFFRQTEPSSPVPLLLERAARLVSKSFLEVLADMAPDGVAQARAAGGIRKDEG